MTTLPKLRVLSQDMLHLDLLRFLAAVGVVVVHTVEFLYSPTQRPFAVLKFGQLAFFVDLFFAISGFAIAYVYGRRVATPKQVGYFLQRRVGRLVPLHWLTMLAAMAVWLAVLLAGYWPEHMPSWRPECILGQALLLNPVIPCGQYRFNDISWSVSAEMVMYYLFPVFAAAANRWRGALPAFLILFFLLFGSYLLRHDWRDLHVAVRALPSFLFGMTLFYYREQLQLVPIPQFFVPVLVVGLVISMTMPGPAYLTMALVYMTVVTAVAADVQKKVPAVVARFAALGQLTYSIYMWHGLFILVLVNMLGDKILRLEQPKMLLVILFSYGLIFGWSYISFFFIETPARRWVDALPFWGGWPAGGGNGFPIRTAIVPGGAIAYTPCMNDLAQGGSSEARRKRLLFRAQRRGFKEVDLIFGAYAQDHLTALDEAALDQFEALLAAPDQEVYAWLRGAEAVPADFDNAVFAGLQSYCGRKGQPWNA